MRRSRLFNGSCLSIRLFPQLKAAFLEVGLILVFSLLLTSAYAQSPENKDKNGNNVETSFDFGDPPKTPIFLTPELSLGARLEFEHQLEENYNLHSNDPNDLRFLAPAVSLAFKYQPVKQFYAYFNLEYSGTLVKDEEKKKDNETSLDLKLAYVSFNKVIEGMTLTVGRQRMDDEREWLFDDNLDSVRLAYTFQNIAFDFFAGEKRSRDLINNEKDDEAVNYYVSAAYSLNKDSKFTMYSFYRDDRVHLGENPIFLGVSLYGALIKHFDYWLEFAHVRGKSGSNRIKGFGFDVGFKYKLSFLPLKPRINMSVAFGTGDDDPGDGKDENFRQTGLQDNNAKLGGIPSVQFYGEMFRPELSNMGILTMGLAIRPTRSTSIELMYHYYHQHHPADEIRDSDVDEDPDGRNEELGQEIDVIVGFKQKPHVNISLVFGYFIPGAAFPNDPEPALFSEFKVRYDF